MTVSKKLEVTVTDTGVQFGGAWFSHESVTGYTAEQLNSGDCHVTGKHYVKWMSQDAAQSELAALREELAAQKETVALFESEFSKQSVSLTAAEQRNADMSKLLQRCIPVCRYKGSHTERQLINEIEAVLAKPTESGASE